MADLQGFDELYRAMDESKLTFSGKRKLIAKALREAAKPIRDDGEAAAPVLSGRLKGNIKVSVVEQTADGGEARIGPTDKTFYGKFDEYGTSRQPRRPWLGPAYDRNEPQAVETVSKILGDGIAESFYG